MSNVGVVIPWQAGCPHRERAVAHVVHHIAVQHPTFNVVLGECAGEWSKGTAAADGVRQLGDVDVVIVWDADVVVSPAAIDAALDNLEGWAIPHNLVHRLSEESTARFIAGHPLEGLHLSGDGDDRDATPYAGYPGGGIVVATASAIASVPLDPRFIGWGHEDTAWATALTCVVGPPWRGDADLVHLWHPPQERRNRLLGSQPNQELFLRYRRAARWPAQMRALLDEIGAPTCRDSAAV